MIIINCYVCLFFFFPFIFVEFGSLTTSQLMEKVRGLQNLAFQLGLDEGTFLASTFPRLKSDHGLIYFSTSLNYEGDT